MRLKTKAFWAVGLFGLALWFTSAPRGLEQASWPEQAGDAQRGATVFALGGCASCHMAKGAKGEARLLLGGGQVFSTPFGTFYAPNISPGKDGIGSWSRFDLANALLEGVSPEGAHYYPSFPYSSYARMGTEDITDLKAYLDTLPVVTQANKPHDLPFPFNIRRSVGFWKLMFLRSGPVVDSSEPRGQYLVEGLAHCAQCHTPRNALGALDTSRWLAGAPNPEGKGTIPDLTPGGNLADWSVEDIAYYLESGFTPEYDTAGGTMVEVVKNLSQASAEDRLAIARYLKALPKP
ncbi:MAG: cytochrome c [Rhodobacteraceae bacterium]|nr:cytochrome c [Paracoccaceae bacterium]